MHQTTLFLHQRWEVHRGENSDISELLYTVQKSSSFPLKRLLQVFLASNKTKDTSDFRVVGCYSSQSFEVFKGEMLIAEVQTLNLSIQLTQA